MLRAHEIKELKRLRELLLCKLHLIHRETSITAELLFTDGDHMVESVGAVRAALPRGTIKVSKVKPQINVRFKEIKNDH